MTQANIDSLWANFDANPNDLGALLVISDAYRDMGCDLFADVLAQLVADRVMVDDRRGLGGMVTVIRPNILADNVDSQRTFGVKPSSAMKMMMWNLLPWHFRPDCMVP